MNIKKLRNYRIECGTGENKSRMIDALAALHEPISDFTLIMCKNNNNTTLFFNRDKWTGAMPGQFSEQHLPVIKFSDLVRSELL